VATTGGFPAVAPSVSETPAEQKKPPEKPSKVGRMVSVFARGLSPIVAAIARGEVLMPRAAIPEPWPTQVMRARASPALA